MAEQDPDRRERSDHVGSTPPPPSARHAEDERDAARTASTDASPPEASTTSPETSTATSEPPKAASESSTAASESSTAASEPPAAATPSASSPPPPATPAAGGTSASSPPPPPPRRTPPRGAAWAEPLARFERAWTRFETGLLTIVLLSLILALISWVFLTGLAAPPSSDDAAGVVFRAIVGASLLGTAAWTASRTLTLNARRGATIVAFIAGIAVAPLWRSFGTQYFDNVKAWLQEGSTLTLMGGLRGVGTRLTLWLALLGGSLATSAGKHIHVDLLFRALPVKLRVPAAVLNNLAAAAVCFAAVWGFFDHIAIESFGARADDPPAAKIERVTHHVGQHLFLARKQVALDLRSGPRVIAGNPYEWMTPTEWNGWLDGAGYAEHYPEPPLDNFKVPDDAPPHIPLVISPDGESTRGLLVHTLSLVFPFGLLMIGLRFLLRILLVLSGHISVDPDEAHREDLRRADQDGDPLDTGGHGERAEGRA
ncbi:TRAP transporter small permease subunit [Chondromyces crocatus]|uniref:Tripartite ATP-independent periplasmic transporters DctQ component domain-containing protein n=1 Tax=Chondromyces crocatus TaxID=52 RepID=A0A0K1ELC1_CHOCO|nr:TRAP transporter small permease subunit [Chondromyces crocatus]AKT41413.1 uncharacterized protein CMC5_056130 [Chondromyces crocatus]